MENKKICPSCGATFPAETKFCTCCGTKLPDAPQPEPVKTMFCFNCGAKIPAEAVVCPSCGTPQKLKKKRLRRQHSGRKRAVAAVLAAAALAGCALGMRALIGKGGGKATDYIVYAKDGELMYSTTKKLEPIQLTMRLCTDGRDNIDFEFFGDVVRVSSDGKKILYPDRCTEGVGVTLYYRDLSRKNAEPVKIDTEITEFYVAKDFSSIHYLKGGDGLLYRHDFKEKEKIASGVRDIYASEDGKKVIFRDEDGNAYYRAAKDKEKIGHAKWLNQVFADAFSVIYTGEDDAFYRWQKDPGESKLAAEGHIEYLNTDGKGFFSKANEFDKVSISDLIVDDMAENDADEMPAISEPRYSDYEDIADYEKAYEEYTNQKESMEAKEYREYLRSAAMNGYSTTLSYFDGEQTIELSDTVCNILARAEDELSILYAEYNTDEPKLKISEIPTGRDASSIFDDVKKKLVYAKGDQLYTVGEIGDLDRAGISNDGRMLFYLYYDEDQIGNLMKVKITSKGIEESELVDSGVSMASWIGNKLYYCKFTEDDEIELYCDGLPLERDVNMSGMNSTDRKLAYFADWNTSRDEGTLKMTDGKKSVKVCDDVSSYVMTLTGGLAYLSDYSRSREEGTLYFYNGKKSAFLDSDVEYVYYPKDSYYCYCGHIGY